MKASIIFVAAVMIFTGAHASNSNDLNSNEDAALLFGVLSWSQDQVKVALTAGADPNAQFEVSVDDGKEWTASITPFYAALTGMTDIYGEKDWDFKSSELENEYLIIEAMVRNGADLNFVPEPVIAPGFYGSEPLFVALSKRRWDVVKLLLDSGVDRSEPILKRARKMLPIEGFKEVFGD